MGFSSDVAAVTKTATATAVNGRTRLVAIYYIATATATTLTFRTGGASGTTILTLFSPAAAGAVRLNIPEDGILFNEGIHLTFLSNSNVTSVTMLFVGGAAA